MTKNLSTGTTLLPTHDFPGDLTQHFCHFFSDKIKKACVANADISTQPPSTYEAPLEGDPLSVFTLTTEQKML